MWGRRSATRSRWLEPEHLYRGLWATSLVLAGCSYLLDPNANQCATDQDCKRFRADALCDVKNRVCVLPSGNNGATDDAGLAQSAACVLDAGDGRGIFVSTCTTSTCIPFDNARRLSRFSPDGTLVPVPAKP
jgi:hypothetical protein